MAFLKENKEKLSIEVIDKSGKSVKDKNHKTIKQTERRTEVKELKEMFRNLKQFLCKSKLWSFRQRLYSIVTCIRVQSSTAPGLYIV